MVIRKMRLQVGGMLKMIICCHVVALLFTTGLLLHCPQRGFVGINTDYTDLAIHVSDHDIKAECNEHCNCKEEWNPVCEAETGRMYFSPCFAGCTQKHADSHGVSCLRQI
ncbi:unnamed protein product [Cylicostephanus goldi]|uniref:Kazal-like domain-containing protein n=1 Tax=Cylicostephanus goldi TaxID=71465 RepID=A0A3P6SXS1_CYLGO|nr:unnamed protein product [Cylicostephanus goldi]